MYVCVFICALLCAQRNISLTRTCTCVLVILYTHTYTYIYIYIRYSTFYELYPTCASCCNESPCCMFNYPLNILSQCETYLSMYFAYLCTLLIYVLYLSMYLRVCAETQLPLLLNQPHAPHAAGTDTNHLSVRACVIFIWT